MADFDTIYSHIIITDYNEKELDMYYHENYYDHIITDFTNLKEECTQLKHLTNNNIDNIISYLRSKQYGYKYNRTWMEILNDVKLKQRLYKIHKIMDRNGGRENPHKKATLFH